MQHQTHSDISIVRRNRVPRIFRSRVFQWRQADRAVRRSGMIRFLILAAIYTIVVTVPGSVLAQSNGNESVPQQIDSIDRAVSLIDRLSNSETADDQTLASARVKLDGLSHDLQKVGIVLSKRLGEVSARLEQLAPAASDDSSAEPAAVSEERKTLGDEKAELIVLTGKIDQTMSSIAVAVERIAAKRRADFTAALLLRTPIDLALFRQAAEAAQNEFSGLRSLVTGWLRFVFETRATVFALSTAAAFVLALFLFVAIRRLFSSLLYRDPTIEAPSYFAKIIIAFWSAILPSMVFAAFLAVTYGLYSYFGILSPKISLIAKTLFFMLAGIFFFYNLVQGILTPNHSNWRLLDVSDAVAKKLSLLTVTMATVYAIDAFLATLNEILAAPLPLTIFKSLITSLLIGAVILAIASVRKVVADDVRVEKETAWPIWISLPLLLVGLSVIAAALLGYIGLARFAAQQIVVTGASLVTIYIGILAGRQIGSEGLLAQSQFGRWLQDRLSLQTHTIEQLSIVAGLLFIGFVILAGLPLILLQWGSQPDDIFLWAGRIFSGFQIGAVRISLSGLLFGFFVFAAGLIVTRLVQKWISTSVLPRSKLDSGVRDSIKTGVGYTGIALAALIAVTSAGIDLSNLAIVAGALSIGIGFGLQNVVSNFVSGLILLVERPIKVGDWVEAGGTSGFVKKISVRATEIETFQKQSMILPNSELINSVVGNWTHKYRGGRVDIPVGVAYGSDVREVEAILYRLATEQDFILKYPEPFVFFKGFGDSSLDFELRFYLSDITASPKVSSQIRFAMIDAFQASGIVIPFPQRDLHIHSGKIEAPAAGTSGPPNNAEKIAEETKAVTP